MSTARSAKTVKQECATNNHCVNNPDNRVLGRIICSNGRCVTAATIRRQTRRLQQSVKRATIAVRKLRSMTKSAPSGVRAPPRIFSDRRSLSQRNFDPKKVWGQLEACAVRLQAAGKERDMCREYLKACAKTQNGMADQIDYLKREVDLQQREIIRLRAQVRDKKKRWFN